MPRTKYVPPAPAPDSARKFLRCQVTADELRRLTKYAKTRGYDTAAAWLRTLVNADLIAHNQPQIADRGVGAPVGNTNARRKEK